MQKTKSITQLEDMEKQNALVDKFLKSPQNLPISFEIEGKKIQGIPADWKPVSRTRILDATMMETIFEGCHPGSGLWLRVECVVYKDFPVVEWTAWFANPGSTKTPIISNIQILNAELEGKNPVLNHYKGDFWNIEGYEPFLVPLKPGDQKQLSPKNGRACDVEFPYYRILCDKGGYTLSIGWPGQWATSFTGTQSGVHVVAGQQTTHLSLNPGESIRTPRITLMTWTGDTTRAINLWRRWYRAHILPRPDGKPIQTLSVGVGTGEGEEFTGATEENQIEFINRYLDKKLPFDLWWIDAGWYPCYNKEHKREWWETGSWIPDPERFPNGLKPVGDKLAKEGKRFLVWFEPERVRPDSALDKEHPDWLLRSEDEGNHLLFLGNPEARQWLTDHVCKLIQESGITVYRQDHNFPGLPYWRANETNDRQGLNENLHVQGYLQYWDDLLDRNPGLWIDSCSAGGRRNDLETMRRSVPLHYTDYGYGDHEVKLAFHRTMFEWIPYFKECTLSWDTEPRDRFDNAVDSFSFHCGFAAMIFPTIDIRREDYDYDTMRKMLGVWRQVADILLHGDFYALTPYHKDKKQWVAFQFDSPEEGKGYIQGIRLQECADETLTVKLHALDEDVDYLLENPETGESKTMKGDELAKQGFTFKMPKRSGQVWTYRKSV